jgi:hypothetical protein
MGESESQGRWQLNGHTSVVAVIGQCHIDLSRAEIEGPEIVITALGISGSVEIVVPEGIAVERLAPGPRQSLSGHGRGEGEYSPEPRTSFRPQVLAVETVRRGVACT